MFSNGQIKKAVTFSYDDGVTQDIRLIELLNKYGLKYTFNLNSELLAKKGILIRNGQRISHYKLHPKDVPSVYAGHAKPFRAESNPIAAEGITADLEEHRGNGY